MGEPTGNTQAFDGSRSSWSSWEPTAGAVFDSENPGRFFLVQPAREPPAGDGEAPRVGTTVVSIRGSRAAPGRHDEEVDSLVHLGGGFDETFGTPLIVPVTETRLQRGYLSLAGVASLLVIVGAGIALGAAGLGGASAGAGGGEGVRTGQPLAVQGPGDALTPRAAPARPRPPRTAEPVTGVTPSVAEAAPAAAPEAGASVEPVTVLVTPVAPAAPETRPGWGSRPGVARGPAAGLAPAQPPAPAVAAATAPSEPPQPQPEPPAPAPLRGEAALDAALGVTRRASGDPLTDLVTGIVESEEREAAPSVAEARTLTRQQVVAGMRRVARSVSSCTSGERVSVDVTVVGATGRVASARVVGPLAGSAQARCVERVVQNAAFPRFSESHLNVRAYPFAGASGQ